MTINNRTLIGRLIALCDAAGEFNDQLADAFPQFREHEACDEAEDRLHEELSKTNALLLELEDLK